MELISPVEETFDEQQFPCTAADLIDEHGDTRLELPNGATTLGETLGLIPGDEPLRTREDARLALCNALSEEAIGRKGYSDRDSPCPGEDGPERLSL